ncbi:hypothetical protein VP01_5638g1, partial [Puccinia sorghi]
MTPGQKKKAMGCSQHTPPLISFFFFSFHPQVDLANGSIWFFFSYLTHHISPFHLLRSRPPTTLPPYHVNPTKLPSPQPPTTVTLLPLPLYPPTLLRKPDRATLPCYPTLTNATLPHLSHPPPLPSSRFPTTFPPYRLSPAELPYADQRYPPSPQPPTSRCPATLPPYRINPTKLPYADRRYPHSPQPTAPDRATLPCYPTLTNTTLPHLSHPPLLPSLLPSPATLPPLCKTNPSYPPATFPLTDHLLAFYSSAKTNFYPTNMRIFLLTPGYGLDSGILNIISKDGKGGRREKEERKRVYRNIQSVIMRPQTPTKLLFIRSGSSINHSTFTLLSPSIKILSPLIPPQRNGRCVITDPKDRKFIIAVIEFTPWEQLTENNKDDLNFLSTFLHGSKEFINP